MLHRTLSSKSHDGIEHEEIEASFAILFPWFSVFIGIFVYYFLSRYAHAIPYTAFMFIVGVISGYSTLYFSGNTIIESTRLWLGINGEVIILAFLPGLLFLDSYNINVYLFRQSFSQLLVFAFPMVLAGTTLTALVAWYILPYGWSFDLCMTFGSILAATDPVAVAALLNELGAPARLKTHIAGESLLNDGSAVVFFHIFSSRFFYELGFGEDIGWLRGFALFFRLSLGGACIGLLFGIGLVTMLFNFNRRLSQDENVIQVTATVTIAYLAFFTSEIILNCSGIIAVVFCGLTTKAFGETLLNDLHLTHDFWHIAEHLLNSILFTLGGAVWGGVIFSPDNAHSFGGIDWAYLLLLFVLVVLIRFALVFAFFPITRKLGIGQSIREAIFMSYGGLRGAVGIALAMLLSTEVTKYSKYETVSEETRNQYTSDCNTVFGMVGGIAFLTLIINAPTSGPLLKSLGLVKPTETRKNVVLHYIDHMRRNTLIAYLHLIVEKRFDDIDFGIVRQHVSPLQRISEGELNVAVDRYQKLNPSKNLPNLTNIAKFTTPKSKDKEQAVSFQGLVTSLTASSQFKAGLEEAKSRQRETLYDFSATKNDDAVLEERSIFLELLRQEYRRQLSTGELDSRGFIPYCLIESLDIAEQAGKGRPLNDWAALQNAGTSKGERALHAYRVGGLLNRKRDNCDNDFHVIRTQVLQALSFITAHEHAQETFKIEFASVDSSSLSLAEKSIIDESREQVARAESAISAFDPDDVSAVKSQYVCQILLHKSAGYFGKLSRAGLMTKKEASKFLEKYDLELRKLRLNSELKTEISSIRWLSQKQIAPETGLTLETIPSGSEW